ncbi:MAG TPA: hypothetical protein VHU83_16235 [Bryobacteraceae bacterium]|nr:hypothetical protein [Bryobacteraceae bacterium]
MGQFLTCQERISRARKHRKNLIDTWNRFLEDEPYSSGVAVNDDGTGRIYVLPRYDSLPSVFALELGELLYQLRAALDAAVYQSAILDSGKDPPPDEANLQFPIVTKPANFSNAGRNIRPLSDKRKAIIESVQPYKTPQIGNFNRAIGILSDWARKDRHRKLHVLMSWAGNISPLLRIPEGTDLTFLNIRGDGLLEKESEIATFKLGGWMRHMNIQANPNLTIDIAIDEIPPQNGPTDSFGNRIEAMFMAVEQITSDLASV